MKRIACSLVLAAALSGAPNTSSGDACATLDKVGWGIKGAIWDVVRGICLYDMTTPPGWQEVPGSKW